MSNKFLFQNMHGKAVMPVDHINSAGGKAYKLGDKEALLQFVMTGTFNGTYYKSATDILTQLLEILGRVDNAFIFKAAIYARDKGKMKDMPALLVAYIGVSVSEQPDEIRQLWRNLFFRVIDNGRMLRNFIQMIRSGHLMREVRTEAGIIFNKPVKSFGSMMKSAVQEWLNEAPASVLMNAYTGTNPTMNQVMRMFHPKPKNEERKALFSFFYGNEVKKEMFDNMPDIFKRYILIIKMAKTMPDFPLETYGTSYKDGFHFQLLSSLGLPSSHWKHIAKTMSINTLRMNLNNLLKWGVFEKPITKDMVNLLPDNEMIDFVCARLMDEESLKYVIPYQLFMTYMSLDDKIPTAINIAVQKSINIAMKNIPAPVMDIVIGVDVSGSMDNAITGDRGRFTSQVKCNMVAALIACAYITKASQTPGMSVYLVPFDSQIREIKLNPLDTIVTNAEKLSKCGGGGTDCSIPFRFVNQEKVKVQLMILISDNESWINNGRSNMHTTSQIEWRKVLRNNHGCKLVCLDLQPNRSTQVRTDASVLNIGGFSDEIFKRIDDFCKGTPEESENSWVKHVEEIELPYKRLDKFDNASDNEEPSEC